MRKTFKLLLKLFLITSIFVPVYGCASLKFADPNPPKLPELPKIDNVKIALVLGGGGAKGIAHVGVLEELSKAGIKPDVVIGCSAGAIVGALYADNPDPKRLKSLILPSKASDVMNMNIFNLPFGLYNGDRLEKFLTKNLVAAQFNKLQIPFIAVATQLADGALVPFGSGPMIGSVRASAAYLGAFKPVKLYGRQFVDGGVADPIPVQVAKKFGAKIIIAVDISAQLTSRTPRHLFGVIKRSLEIGYIKQSALSAKEADIIIKVPLKNIGVFTDKHNTKLYNAGRKAAAEMLPKIKELIAVHS